MSEFYVKALQTDWNALKIVKYFVKSPPSTFMRCLQLIYMFELFIEHRAWMLKSLGTLQTRSLPLHYRGDQLLGAVWWGREGRSSRALKKRSRSLTTRSWSLKPGADLWRREAGSQLSRWRHRLLFGEKPRGLRCGNPKYSTFSPSFFGWALFFLWFSPLIILHPNRLNCRTTAPSLGELFFCDFWPSCFECYDRTVYIVEQWRLWRRSSPFI